MEEELQEIMDLAAQLRADNERLRLEWVPIELLNPGTASLSVASLVMPQLVGMSVRVAKRFVFIPRDRCCPKFHGRACICINEWVEEAQVCMRVHNMSLADQAFFLFDHLEGEACNEINIGQRLKRAI